LVYIQKKNKLEANTFMRRFSSMEGRTDAYKRHVDDVILGDGGWDVNKNSVPFRFSTTRDGVTLLGRTTVYAKQKI